MLNRPLTVGVVGVIIGPMLTLVGLSAAVLSKCKIKIANEDGDTVIDLGEFSEEKFNTIKDMVSNKAKDVKEAMDKAIQNPTEDTIFQLSSITEANAFKAGVRECLKMFRELLVDNPEK